MSRGFSRVILVGNLGRDPEMRYSQSGVPITNFSLAVNRRRRGQDGNYQDETNWYRVTLFRNQAESAAEWLRKGSKVLVEGQLRIHTYTGQDGVERTSIDVEADNFMNLTPRDEFAGGGAGTAPRPQAEDRDNVAQFPQRSAPAGGAQRAPRKDDPFDDDDLDDVPF